jgi:kinesin family protein 2/24
MPVASVLTRNDGNAPSANGRVRQWLSRAGLGEYRENFSSASEREFAALGMVDFAQFGVVDVAHKQTLFRLIKNLNAEGVVFEKNPNTLRASLLDVDAAEHDEFLLSPLARRDPRDGSSARNDGDHFAPSPAEDDPRISEKNRTTEETDEIPEKPLEHLRRLSRESRVKDIVSDQNVTLRGSSSAEEDAREEKDGNPSSQNIRDPAKTPFVANGRFVDGTNDDEIADTPPLATLPLDQPRIRVVVRKRPLNAKELAREEEDVVTVDRRVLTDADEKEKKTAPSSVTVWEPKTKVDLTQYTEEHLFSFDDVFPEEVDNDEVYKTTVAPLVGTVFDKCKVTCFAYGQTGSGKTYTMNPLPIRAAREILGELSRRRRLESDGSSASNVTNLALHVSFFEIYGGKVYDLLNGRAKLVIREDARSQMCVVGLKEFEVADVRLVEQLIKHGTAARCVGSTGANAESSRSHAIMQFVLKRSSAACADDELEEKRRVPASVVARRLRNAAGANHERIHGKFSFIDLAGSERGADTSENDRQTRIEGAEINKSLLALKECIRALDRGTGHVPFRGSKLTEVLRDSFMGNSRTVMIANVSPATGSCEHTLNTLRYAYRVKELRDGGKDNEPSKTEANASRATRFAADGVTPVGAPEKEKEKESSLPSDKEKTSSSGFDPRVAAKAAAARVRDATRKSAELEAEKAAEKKRGAASFLTKGGGAGGGATAGVTVNALLSPRRAASSRMERPKSAAPGGFLSARGGGAGGSPTKEKPARISSVGVASRARPQTARVGSGPSYGAQSGTSLGATARRESLVHGARKNALQTDPRVTAFDPTRGGESIRGSGPVATGSGPEPSKEARRTETSAAEAANGDARRSESQKPPAKAAEKNTPAPAVPSGNDQTKKHLVPLSGSALAAAKAHAHLQGVGPPVDQEEMTKAHDELINVILEEEEAVIAAHRAQIENAMALVKREMSLLAEVDKPGSAIDVYVEHLADVLEKKQRDIQDLRDKVRAFKTHLKEEEVLSKAVGLH